MRRKPALLVLIGIVALSVGSASGRPRVGPPVYRTLHFGGSCPTGLSFVVQPGHHYELRISLNAGFQGAVQADGYADYPGGGRKMTRYAAWTFPPHRGEVRAQFRTARTRNGATGLRAAVNVQPAEGSYADVHVVVYDLTDEVSVRVPRPSVSRYRR